MKWIVPCCMAAAAVAPQARLVEVQLDVPVQVTDARHRAIAQPIRLIVFFDDSTSAPRPLVVMNHGRAPDADGRVALGRAHYRDASRWFPEQGFIVAVPTRIGYGLSGGQDVEDSGPCNRKNYAPGCAAAAQQTLAVIDAVRARDDTLKDRSVVLGQSYGGATAVAVAALDPPGVVATINVAGGGGNPKTRPGDPCAPHLLGRLFSDYGRSSRVSTLWIYAGNEQYFGMQHPVAWFDAYKQAGGLGCYVHTPPHGDDGHALFRRFAAVWQPVVAQFLREHGFDLKDAA
jgi:dienelactone hydrolase